MTPLGSDNSKVSASFSGGHGWCCHWVGLLRLASRFWQLDLFGKRSEVFVYYRESGWVAFGNCSEVTVSLLIGQYLGSVQKCWFVYHRAMFGKRWEVFFVCDQEDGDRKAFEGAFKDVSGGSSIIGIVIGWFSGKRSEVFFRLWSRKLSGGVRETFESVRSSIDCQQFLKLINNLSS